MWVAASGVHRTRTTAPWWAKAAATTAAAVVAGAFAGAAVGGLGGFLDAASRAAIGLVAGAVLFIAPLLRVPVPQRNAETPQVLLHHGPLRWAIANGAMLGLAVTNRIGFWLWYLVPVGCFVSGSARTGAMLWAAYAFSRMIVVDLLAWRMRGDEGRVHRLTTWLLAGRARVRPAMTMAAIVAGAALAVILH